MIQLFHVNHYFRYFKILIQSNCKGTSEIWSNRDGKTQQQPQAKKIGTSDGNGDGDDGNNDGRVINTINRKK